MDQLDQALDRLVAAKTLTSDQAAAVRTETATVRNETPPPPGSSQAPDAPSLPERPLWVIVLAEIGAYVGGAFVAGSAAVLIADNWGELGTAARVAVLDIPAVLLLVATWLVTRMTPSTAEGDQAGPGDQADDAGRGTRRRMVAAFLTVAAALLGAGTAVITDASSVSEEIVAASGFGTALIVVGAGYALFRGLLLHVGTAFALLWTVMPTAYALGVPEDSGSGWILVALGLIWAGLTLPGVLKEPELGYALAGGATFIGSEVLVGTGSEPVGYTLLILLALAGMGGFVVLRAFAVLVTGVGTLAVVVPQLVIDVTDGALGAAGALLIVGLSIVGASVVGLRLRRTASPAEG
ncbi:MAG: hypothetical protein QG622_3441 [Actinomycetota bacterium]|nr:hypothetical protein [Actinomycetota bacterium]